MAEADPNFDGKVASSVPLRKEDAPARTSRLRPVLLFSVPLLVLGVGAYLWLTSGRSVSTDNAYVKQDIVSISSDVNGRITSVNVRENQLVNKGDILFAVDPEPYRVALEQANAQIATAQVEVTKLNSDYQATSVDISGAQEDISYAQEDYARQRALMAKGFTTRARLEQSEHALAQARESLRTAQADAQKARAALATGSQVPGVNPAIAAARAQRDRAQLELTRTVVRAPVSGRISQSQRLQVGQMMVTGLPAVSIVAKDRSWVEANFKETDLNRMAPGLPATVEFDAYPGLKLKGHVESLGAGTGSQFSVIPAQNATGNWVKVTQRVPVRIAIDERSSRPMIAGLSADVTVKFDDARR
ncbi:HlyD family secretion protein [Sphingobium subterraneum]|uniref:Membrane fusion protein (Multidrug efflux system) n=1 Tax=Sphingobium subterraneum TaxID=627688 RepID=A0A841J110_9SPHN|nr:HlyD family secretion protein [Sphingobium subterraneum]MBB6124527.1 membrane fusion protein (multidrug efflux system) [Sphingobium subterraneum]